MWKILLGAAFDVMRGKDSRSKWADPDCPTCKGTGFAPGLASGEWCYCAYRGVNTTLAEKVHENRQPPASTSKVYRQRDYRTTAAAKALADADAHFAQTSAPVIELSAGQKEQQDIEWRIRDVLDRPTKLALSEGRLPWCCVRTPCVCGMEHWRDDPIPTAPSPDSSIYEKWRQHRDWVMSWSQQPASAA